MIASLRGVVGEAGNGFVVIEAAGVGYHVQAPANVVEALIREPGEVRVLIHFVMRDDGISLYGFLDRTEREMFRLLLSVNRIGPAIALAVLSRISVPDLAAAILQGEEDVLMQVQGIGKKGAQRVILELKDRMAARIGPDAGFSKGAPAGIRDAIEALVTLGFSPREAADAVAAAAAAGSGTGPEPLIRAALVYLREK